MLNGSAFPERMAARMRTEMNSGEAMKELILVMSVLG
jgi:hypothetical protein